MKISQLTLFWVTFPTYHSHTVYVQYTDSTYGCSFKGDYLILREILDFTSQTRGSVSMSLEEGVLPFYSKPFMPGKKYLVRSDGGSRLFAECGPME